MAPSLNPGPSDGDPWRDTVPLCLLYEDASDLRTLIDAYGAARIAQLQAEVTDSRVVILVDCRTCSDPIDAARQRFTGHSIVGVVARFEATSVMELLARGADGVVAQHDPPAVWRECLNVVRGGGRWLGGPGVEVSLEEKVARHGVARGEQHVGDVTLRTQHFIRGRVGDKLAR